MAGVFATGRPGRLLISHYRLALAVALKLLIHLTACDQKCHIYTASTNGVHHALTEQKARYLHR